MKVYYLYPEQKEAVVRALLGAGEIYVGRQQWNEASQAYRKVITLSPKGEEGVKAREMLKVIEESRRREKEKD